MPPRFRPPSERLRLVPAAGEQAKGGNEPPPIRDEPELGRSQGRAKRFTSRDVAADVRRRTLVRNRGVPG
jgi:hypothetical protein